MIFIELLGVGLVVVLGLAAIIQKLFPRLSPFNCVAISITISLIIFAILAIWLIEIGSHVGA